MAIKLTEKGVNSLKTDKRQQDVADLIVRGLFVRVFPSGVKQFYLRYRNAAGRQRKMLLGDARTVSLARARELARNHLAAVLVGEDPLEQKQAYRASEAFEDVAQRFIEHSELRNRPRTAVEDRRLLEKEVIPKWKGRKLSELRRSDAILLLESILARDVPVLTNRVHQVLSRLFEFAVDREITDANPLYRLRKLGHENSRTRVLRPDEIREFLTYLDSLPNQSVPNIYRLCLLTLCRAGEACGMRWAEIRDGDWTIPAERMKNRREHFIPFSKQALEVIENQRVISEATGSDSAEFVFPSTKGGHIREHKKVMQRYFLRHPERERFSTHDLRRTGATMMQQLGVSHEVIEAALSHSLKGVAATYQRGRRENQLQLAFTRLGFEVASLKSGTKGGEENVVRLRAQS